MRLNPLLMEKLAGEEEYAAGRDLEELGAVRIAEEDKGFSFSLGRVLKSKDVAEFAAIVGEQSRENIAEWETIRSQICFEGLNFFACLSGNLTAIALSPPPKP